MKSIKNDSSVEYHCSSIPYIYTQLQLFDPYAWDAKTGISLRVEKDKLPDSFFGEKEVKFEYLDAPSIPTPVSISGNLQDIQTRKNLSTKISHWTKTRKGEPEIYTDLITNWSIEKIPTFSELNSQQKKEFIAEWREGATSDFKKIFGTSALAEKNYADHALINSFGKGFKFERYVCSTKDTATCVQKVTANPADGAMYYLYSTWNDPLTQKIYTTMKKLLYPISYKRITDGMNEIQLQEAFTNWTEIQTYQITMCPISDVLDDSTENDYVTSVFKKLIKDDSFVSASTLRNQFDKFKKENSNYSGLPYRELLKSINYLCKNPTSSENELLKEYYNYVAFRGANVYFDGNDGTVVTTDNLNESLYNSYIYTPV